MSGDRRRSRHGESHLSQVPVPFFSPAASTFLPNWAPSLLHSINCGHCELHRVVKHPATKNHPQLITSELELYSSPKSVQTRRKNTSPWPAQIRSDHVVFGLVLASLCVLITYRPNQLCWTEVDHREHLELFPGCAVTVARDIWLAIHEIDLVETFTRSRIWFRSKKRAGPCVNRPVRGLAGALPRRSPSWSWRGKGIELQGLFCICQRLSQIVPWPRFQLFNKPRSFLQSPQRRRGRALSTWVGPPRLDLAQNCLSFYLFIFCKTLRNL
jgi:hypothetical protein